MNRINEISFNSSLMREMRAIAFVTDLIDQDKALSAKLKKVHIHSIAADEVTADLDVASKFNVDWEFLSFMRDLGRDHAGRWLKENFQRLGRESTVDVRTKFL